ncbi:hypothetical protein ACFSTE_16920 [Aquimarina hainanensis]|uniref:Uncharacterized protein n=1 Tax=Aquimarina hainanensis TaxID=1578017 RepID=A0ABW5NBN6_9FLAO|nr:hypothetical protein [Aquimarina sp. TRL1]QKX06976.1 hypothetical protein HN014_19320 [Aquimarina sp. TRL1]
MKIDKCLIKEFIKKAAQNGFLKIKDHRGNNIVLDNGIFTFNGCKQPKTIDSIETIFLEAFKLTRVLHLDNKRFVREGSRWIERAS